MAAIIISFTKYLLTRAALDQDLPVTQTIIQKGTHTYIICLMLLVIMGEKAILNPAILKQEYLKGDGGRQENIAKF